MSINTLHKGDDYDDDDSNNKCFRQVPQSWTIKFLEIIGINNKVISFAKVMS